MKGFTIIMLFILNVLIANAQNYYVIKVEGTVFCNEAKLKTGDKLVIDSQIRFSSGHDKLYLLSPDKGHFVLSPETRQVQDSKNWVTTLRNFIIPEVKFYNTASRNLDDSLRFEDIYDLMGFFRDKVTLIGETKYPVNPVKIILDPSNYFEFSHLDGDSKTLEIKYIPGMDCFTLKTDMPDTKGEFRMQFNYYQQGKKTEIGTFTLIVKDKEEISQELAQFYAASEIKDNFQVYYQQVLPYVKEVYGNTNLQTIRSILLNDLHIQL